MDERKLRHLVWERVLALSDRSSIDVYAMLLLPNLLHRTAHAPKRQPLAHCQLCPAVRSVIGRLVGRVASTYRAFCALCERLSDTCCMLQRREYFLP